MPQKPSQMSPQLYSRTASSGSSFQKFLISHRVFSNSYSFWRRENQWPMHWGPIRLGVWSPMGQPGANHASLFKLAAQPGCAQGPEGLVRCRSLILASQCGFPSGAAFPPRLPSVFLLLLEGLGIRSSGLKSKSIGWTVSQAKASVRFTLQVLIVGETGFSFSNAWICTLTGGSVPRVLVPSNLRQQLDPLMLSASMCH